jgi:hypothetical protein
VLSFSGAEQALLDERADAIDDLDMKVTSNNADTFRRFEREAACKDRETREELLPTRV